MIKIFPCLYTILIFSTVSFAQDVPIGADTPLRETWDQMSTPVDPSTWTLHDPSRIIVRDGVLHVIITGKEQADGYDCGLETWQMRPGDTAFQPGFCLLREKPNWITEELPANDGAYWAATFLTEDLMYYSVSGGFDAEANCIGLARAEGDGSERRWVDSGQPILCSFNNESTDLPYPASIDPSTFIDDDGCAFLVYGGGHIYVIEVDPNTGLPLNDEWWNETATSHIHLANGPQVDSDGQPTDEELWVEAAYLIKREGFYYLFVNWYSCCNGPQSTYQIRVGRSASLDEPFLDRDGVSMLEGGGTLVLRGDDVERGPGHTGILPIEIDGEMFDLLSYHYYPADGVPWATIGTRLLFWPDGWPVADTTPFDLPIWLADQTDASINGFSKY